MCGEVSQLQLFLLVVSFHKGEKTNSLMKMHFLEMSGIHGERKLQIAARKQASSCISSLAAAQCSGYYMSTNRHLPWCQSCLVKLWQSIDFHRTSILCSQTTACCTFTRRTAVSKSRMAQFLYPTYRCCHLPGQENFEKGRYSTGSKCPLRHPGCPFLTLSLFLLAQVSKRECLTMCRIIEWGQNHSPLLRPVCHIGVKVKDPSCLFSCQWCGACWTSWQ